jgi:hypothetical protein
MAARQEPTAEMVQKEIDRAIQILREDAQLAHNQTVLDRLDKLEKQTSKELTPEEKAAEYDRLMAERGRKDPENGPGHGAPQPPPSGPVPPNPKNPPDPPKRTDFWWGDQIGE